MNREKILFLIVLGLVVLWGGLSISGTYEPVRRPNVQELDSTAPELTTNASLPAAQRLLVNLVGVKELGVARSTRSGRSSVLDEHSDLLPVDPAELDLPRALPTPWIGLPVEPFPSIRYYRRLRENSIPPVAAKPEDETAMDGAGGGAIPDDPQPDLPTVGDILGEAEKFEFVPEEWDVLFMGHGTLLYGRISLTKESKATGKTKFDLLLTENNQLVFFFEQLDKVKGRFISSAPMTIEGSGVESVKFSDTIVNQYMTRRTTNRVRADDEIALCDLGDWTLELAEQEKYDRMKGLELARDSYREALDDKPGYLRAILGLGEALHRRFEFDEELGLYQDEMGGKEIPELLSRQARIHRKLGLDDLVVKTLGRAIFHVPGDASLRMRRGEAHLRLGMMEEALTDFVEAEKIATAEDKVAAREGRARTLIAMSRPAEAESVLAGADDVESLVTLGAARYARMKWGEALDAFQQAAELDPTNARAMTNLGIAKARAATEWEDVTAAVEILAKARELSPLNYFYPPLGLGFAEQRFGDPDDDSRQEHFTTSIEHYKTAVESLPGDSYAHYILGRSYLRDGNWEGARKEFRTAYFLDYKMSDALLGAGTAALNLGDWVIARGAFERFTTVENRIREESRDPEEVRVAKRGAVLGHYRLGRAWLASEDVSAEIRLEKAQEQFELAQKLEPMHVPSMNALGYILYNLGKVGPSLDQFDRAKRQAQDGDADFRYAEDAIAKIEDTRGRRRWVETFDRVNSPRIGNNWTQDPSAGVPLSPKLSDGKAVIEGRWARGTSGVWLVKGDPTSRGPRERNNLNNRFIRSRAVVDYRRSDRVEMQYLYYYRMGNSPIKVAVGIGRNARGEVFIIKRKSSDKKWTETVVTDESGETLMWPERPVTLEIIRRDPVKGRFELIMDGSSLGNVDVGLKQSTGPAYVGFLWKGTSGDTFRTVVEELELEIYE